ncbi:TonB-dependent receptor plug domain-containing protein [Sporomusa termitida]|uniref:Vitamin B12 transporter BtuB n=1 Tax=Sporomusa termitida TaxID=2377 RepID=A0A517DNY6_9FIRM|nr:TonB-dependent receptor [Sporomusa termitida]QDR79083.1 Vitamin B12 transporter BtuB [Sporomusa termitida]
MKQKKTTLPVSWEKMVLGLLLTNIMLVPAGAAQAAPDEQAANFTLDSVVITAQRREATDLNTPASVTVITAKELQATGALTIADALDHTLGFNNMSFGPAGTEYGMSAGRTIIRGLDKGTLVLVNGAPANLLNYNSSTGIPLAAVERIEILKGAGSTLYGAEALAGVVNIITKKPGGSQQNTVGVTGGNYNKSWSASSEFGNSAIYIKREYIGAVDRTSRDKLTNAKNAAVLPFGLDKSTKDSFYFTTQLNDRLDFNWSYTDLQSNRPRFNVNGSRSLLYKYDDVRNNINLIYDNKDNNLKSVLAFNKRHSFADQYTYSNKTWKRSERYDMYGINWDSQKTWYMRDALDTFVAGVTLAREHYNGLASSTAVNKNNTLRNSLAVYGAYTSAVNPRLSTTLGLREQLIDDHAKSESVFLPQIQTLYKINDRTSWYTNIGKSFQMPAINQYFSKQGADFNRLKPQQGWNYETGLKKIIDASQSVKLAIYHLDIKDQFVWKKNDDLTDYMTNAGDFRNTGVEAEYVKIINDNWKYNVGFSYSNPENNESGAWVQCNSRIQTTAGVTHNKDKWLTNLNLLYLGDREESYYKINGAVSAVPDRIQLNAAVRYQPEADQTVTLNLYNILDRDNSLNKYENLDLPFSWGLSYNYTF